MFNDLLKFFSLFLVHRTNPDFLQVATQYDKVYTAAGIPLVFKGPDRFVICSSVPKKGCFLAEKPDSHKPDCLKIFWSSLQIAAKSRYFEKWGVYIWKRTSRGELPSCNKTAISGETILLCSKWNGLNFLHTGYTLLIDMHGFLWITPIKANGS